MNEDLVILDRDGVLNRESPDHIKSPAEWIPLPGSLEAVVRLNHAGCRVVLATNQSGIARGYFTVGDFIDIQQHVAAELARLGGRLDAVFYSPDGPDSNSHLRKPRPGMLEEIGMRLGISLDGVPFVGDSLRDIRAARAAGARPVLVRTGNGERTLAEHGALDDVEVFDDLAAFAAHHLARRRSPGAPAVRAWR